MAAVALVAFGVAAAAAWATGRAQSSLVFVAGFLSFIIGAGLFAKAGDYARDLRRFVGHRARVRVWGADLPETGAVEYRLEASFAIGAGLHLGLRPLPEGRRIDLKIAQPSGLTIDSRTAVIAGARYVQWKRARVAKVEGAMPFALEIVE